VATRRISRVALKRTLDRAAELSDLATKASRRARTEDTIDAHRAAIERHRRANVAWVRAHRAVLDHGVNTGNRDVKLERKSYARYASHFDRLREHWQRCWDLGTNRGLSFPRGAPCAPSSAYLLKRGTHPLARFRS
jgi:hypothetical protein